MISLHELHDALAADRRGCEHPHHQPAQCERVLARLDARKPVPPCPCECNSGGFCGGCGHAGCGGRR